MQKNIITISREYGSGGRIIGQKLADKLNIPFYDKEIINMVAQERGFTKEIIEANEENMTGSLLFNLVNNLPRANSIFSGNNVTLQDELFLSQVKIIRELASKGPCVIIGRGADHILKERPDCLNLFIHADLDYRIKRVMEYEDVLAEEAHKHILKQDKTRSFHYQYYTDEKWGDSRNYHLCVDSGTLGIDKCVAIVEDLYMN